MNTEMKALKTNQELDLELVTVDRPTAGPSEVLIKIEAIGLNPADWIAIDSALCPPGMLLPEGVIPGWDLAGTVVALGNGVNRFKVGDRVFGMPKFPALAHSYAEYTTSRAREIAKVPDDVGIIEAGAVPLAGLTAWQSLVDTGKISSGDKVLIHAASGGVGHLAVQVAKSQGAEVWGTASAHNHDMLLELGIDHVIDYRKENFEDVAKEMDLVLVCGGGPETAHRSLQSLRKGGKLVCIAAPLPPQEELDKSGVTGFSILVEPDYKSLESLAELMEEGELKVIIAEQRSFTEMDELHRIGKKGSPLGKLVATVEASYTER